MVAQAARRPRRALRDPGETLPQQLALLRCAAYTRPPKWSWRTAIPLRRHWVVEGGFAKGCCAVREIFSLMRPQAALASRAGLCSQTSHGSQVE